MAPLSLLEMAPLSKMMPLHMAPLSVLEMAPISEVASLSVVPLDSTARPVPRTGHLQNLGAMFGLSPTMPAV
jgi:hypothetical protein